MTCEDHIRELIKERGPISFRDYMNLCLYHPQYGYYTNPVTTIGVNGDFYTSPCVTPLFGEMIASQMEEMWQLMDKQDFSIVEYGGAKGNLCHHILNRLKENKQLYKNLRYYIIDPSVAENPPFIHEKTEWRKNSDDIGKINGCILSNELIDNLPVHRVVMKDRLYEIFVNTGNDGFYEILLPANDDISNYLQESNIQLSYDFNTEINLDALQWINDAASILNEGFIITIDYGFNKNELYNEYRRNGTLTCYYKHTINYNPYYHAGEQDITAHINFSALVHWGKKKHLEFTGYTNQQYFLRSLGLASSVSKAAQDDRTNSFILHFLSGFSNKMKVLIQQKDIAKQRLRGLTLGITDAQQAGLL